MGRPVGARKGPVRTRGPAHNLSSDLCCRPCYHTNACRCGIAARHYKPDLRSLLGNRCLRVQAASNQLADAADLRQLGTRSIHQGCGPDGIRDFRARASINLITNRPLPRAGTGTRRSSWSCWSSSRVTWTARSSVRRSAPPRTTRRASPAQPSRRGWTRCKPARRVRCPLPICRSVQFNIGKSMSRQCVEERPLLGSSRPLAVHEKDWRRRV